ncbi:ankyrin [Colletotrichum zoysiae]|uniref:Ankyrin n=1 Tax=Colletotrichum zoysiae TaxID=1216348 RepID=A0AAD9HNB3_9PEZI|nr:ankyrin [Colletotrichum zoysiae]
MVQKMLRHGAKIDYQYPSNSRFACLLKDGFSALVGGKGENAIFLLEAGANLVGGELAMATASRQDAVVGELLAKGASFEETLTIPGTLSILEAAVLAQDRVLISRTVNVSSQAAIASSLCAAIFVAKSTSDLSIFKLLLDHISVISQSEDLWLGTAMYLAALFGVPESVELMLALGLRPEKCWTMWSFGDNLRLQKGHVRAPENYVSWRQGILTIQPLVHDLLGMALELSKARGLDFFILLRQHGYHRTVRYPDSDGCPSLEHLQWLHSLDVEMTPITLSASIIRGRHDVTKWLIESGVDVNLSSRDLLGDVFVVTPVEAATVKVNLPLVETLLRLGADINASHGPNGVTALQFASMKGDFDPNAPGGTFARTALEGAAKHGKLDVVQLLLNSGVETVGSGRPQYVRAIRFAQKEGHHAVARLIKSHRPWEEADQILYDDKNLLDDNYGDESDEETEEETDEEYKSSRGTSEAEFEALRVPCEVPTENLEVDNAKGGDPNSDFSEGWSSGYLSLVPNGIQEGLAYGVDERAELPGDVIWKEAYETFISELPWLPIWEAE